MITGHEMDLGVDHRMSHCYGNPNPMQTPLNSAKATSFSFCYVICAIKLGATLAELPNWPKVNAIVVAETRYVTA